MACVPFPLFATINSFQCFCSVCVTLTFRGINQTVDQGKVKETQREKKGEKEEKNVRENEHKEKNEAQQGSESRQKK